MLKKISYYLPDLSECWKLFFVILVSILLSGMIVTGGLTYIGYLSNTETNEGLNGWSLLLSTLIGYLPAMLYIYNKGKTEMEKAPAGRFTDSELKLDRPYFGDFSPILAILIIVLGFAGLIVLVDALPEPSSKIPDWMENSYDIIYHSLLPSILSSVVFAPLFEEFLCRVVMLRGLLRKMTPMSAILWSAVLFALLHMNSWQAFPAFFFGVFLGWTYYKTRSYWLVVGLHALNNLSSILLLHYTEAGYEDSLRTLIGDGPVYPVIVAASLIILALSLFVIHKHIPSENNNEQSNLSV